jgi:hydrogenase maturation protein HypF
MVASTSMGRLFDAVASLAGVRHHSAYEAQAAIELEAVSLAAGTDEMHARTYAFGVTTRDSAVVIDSAPVVAAAADDVRRGVRPAVIGARFHDAVATAVVEAVQRVRDSSGVSTVGLSGGVFQNVRLVTATVEGLEAKGFRVLTHRLVPPNDGGLALGQAVAAGLAPR